jgi:tripartite-type tricarboxylate transporter receptor subunit TctC
VRRRAMLFTLPAAALAAAAGLCTPARAEDYPLRPIRLIVPYPPGSGTDIVARLLAQKITENWGQQVIVDNKPGAGAIVGVEAIARAAPDGYTIGIGDTGPLAINPALYDKLPYNPTIDFAAITHVANLPFVLVVHPSLPVTTVTELITLAKNQPGKLNYASVGNGSAVHLASELFKRVAGIDIVHIPYKGSAPALAGLLAGEVSLMFVNLFSSIPHLQAGRLRALAVASPKRTAMLPDLPTMAEAGLPGYAFLAWFGIIAPAGTPAPIIDKLNGEFRRILALSDVRDKMLNQGGTEPVGSTSADFAELMRSDRAQWAKIVRESGARVD